jgi:hypothetical protein
VCTARESQEDHAEDERSPFTRPFRDPGEDRRLRRPPHHEGRPVQGQRERHAGESDPDRDEERRDLGAHPLPEPERSEEDVLERQRENPCRRRLMRAALVEEHPADSRGEGRVHQEHRRRGRA